MDYLFELEKYDDGHPNIIRRGIERFDEVSANLKVDYKVMRRLTYHPELMRLSLNYIRDNKEYILQKEANLAHPLLHELLEQSDFLYHGKSLLNDSKFDQARENLEYFIKELQTIAPEFFEMMDKYTFLPTRRFIGKEGKNVDSHHPATQRIIKLLDFPDKSHVFPKRLYINKTKNECCSVIKDGKMVWTPQNTQYLDLKIYTEWDEVYKNASYIQGRIKFDFGDISNITIEEFLRIWNEYDNSPIDMHDVPNDISLHEWYNKYYMYDESIKVFVSTLSYTELYTDINSYLLGKFKYLEKALGTTIDWGEDSLRAILYRLDYGEFNKE